ncbi:MAG TPA: hypothetical protein PLP19_11150 [bacterium]|nr:hypothetical protein [bacterium]HPN44038.1 hypothetical protein [bacterium]
MTILGLGDFNVSLVFILLILSTLLCVIYGIVRWNEDGEDAKISGKEKQWDKEEKNIEETL